MKFDTRLFGNSSCHWFGFNSQSSQEAVASGTGEFGACIDKLVTSKFSDDVIVVNVRLSVSYHPRQRSHPSEAGPRQVLGGDPELQEEGWRLHTHGHQGLASLILLVFQKVRIVFVLFSHRASGLPWHCGDVGLNQSDISSP